MAWLSSTTAIYIHCSFLFTVAFQLIKAPEAITSSVFILVFGQAMQIDQGSVGGDLSLLCVLLVVLGITDIVQLLIENHKYFESIIPVRLTLCFLLAGVGYLYKGVLHDDYVFVFLFMEIWFHFVIYNVVREEKHDRNKKFEEKLEQELLVLQADDSKFEEVVSKLERSNDI